VCAYSLRTESLTSESGNTQSQYAIVKWNETEDSVFGNPDLESSLRAKLTFDFHIYKVHKNWRSNWNFNEFAGQIQE